MKRRLKLPSCKYCQASITWAEISGKNVPMNLDNSQHRCRTKQNNSQQTSLSISEDQIIQALARVIKKELQV